ncbi:hypothetical protein [Neobacillus bataviensis]|uniref:hypothetical protein n=1 Tax=Neobacillus bataviensis TaxID=220685 RepID=UPI001CBEF476|nr:hypothetical protein [Neobacillus bataviensis]
MAKQKNSPSAMKDMGVPTEMSPINDLSGNESNEPIIEVNQPVKSQDPLEIRTPGSVTVI